MNLRRKIAVGAAAVTLSAASAVMAQPTTPPRAGAEAHDHGTAGHESMMRQGMGPGMGRGMGPGMGMGRGPVGMLTRQDANSEADMGVAMNLVHENVKIRRVVTRLPDGIRTVTESEDVKIAQDIKAHVASMSGRLASGMEFNIFSTTLPVIFDNAKGIESAIEYTSKGVIVTRTSKDPEVAAALQAHADEVTELVKEGPVAFHRGIDARMAMGPAGPRGAGAAPATHRTPARQMHAH